MQESQAINKKTKTVRETKTIHTRTNIHQTKLKHGSDTQYNKNLYLPSV